MSNKINIYEDGVFAGTGDLIDAGSGKTVVANCPAELGSNSGESDGAYELIQSAINASEAATESADHIYTWEIIDE